MELYSLGLVSGFVLGVQHEELDDEQYLLIYLGFIEIIFVW